MKALLLRDYKLFEYTDVPVPEIGRNDVLVKVEACSICGSDVHGYDGKSGRRIPPVIMGHEASGTIESVGENVFGFKPGDRVTFDSTVYCNQCYFCRHGMINLCDNRKVLGVSCADYRSQGAMAEYLAVPQHILYKLPDSVSFIHAALIEPLSVACHAVKNSPVALNDKAVVLGVGTIGQLIVQLLKAAGCSEIIAIDLDETKLSIALQNGATVAIQPSKVDACQKVLDMTHNRGADIVFEAIGINPTFGSAVNLARKGGSVVLVGNAAPKVEFELQKCVTREISLLGKCASSGEYDICIDMIASGKINLDVLISHVAPLEEGGKWFDLLHQQQQGVLKIVLVP